MDRTILVLRGYQAELKENLKTIGFTENAAYHFALLTLPEGSRYIERLQLIQRREYIMLLVQRIDENTQERYFVNESDLRSSALIDLRNRGSSSYQVNNQRYAERVSQMNNGANITTSTSLSASVSSLPTA